MLKYTKENMWSLWDKITKPVHLPTPEGPFIPGGVDVMTEYSQSGSFIRVYYPSDLKSADQKSSDASKTRWIKWIPEYKYFEGCSKLMHLWQLLVWAGYAIIAGANASIPVSWGSRFAPVSSGINEDDQKKTKHPVVIISHGMAGTRFSHSALGLELSSNGFVVASVEHRDCSASGTFHFKSQNERDAGEKTWLSYRQLKFGNDEHYKARKIQVDLRSSEIVKALDVLEKINNGEIGDNDNVLYTPHEGMEFSLSQMKGRLDFAYPAVIGYSFGGPSALLAIKKDPRFRRAIGLDVWMFPIKDEVKETGRALASLPNLMVLFINSQTFHNDINLKTLKNLVSEMKSEESQCQVSEFTTIRGTTHEHLCDWPLLLGSWLDHTLPGKLSPIHSHQLLSHMVLKFLVEPYSKELDMGLTPQLKAICDEYISSQIHHFTMELDNIKSKM